MTDSYAIKVKKFADRLIEGSFSSEAEIKKEMEDLNLTYSENELERLNHVLLALHPYSESIRNKETPNKEINH